MGSIDPRLEAGAYITHGPYLYEVMGRERDENRSLTGMYVLEDCKTGDEQLATALSIARNYVLVKAAPVSGVPEHLDRELAEHCKAAGIA